MPRAEIGYKRDWDDANVEKSWERHGVAFWEAEEVFFNEPRCVRRDPEHSDRERRRFALGHTDAGRRLFISFTLRHRLVRIISARDMTRKETRTYVNSKA